MPTAKRIKIDDLLAIGGTACPPPTPPSETAAGLTPAALDEIKRFYSDHYAPAMDDFLEVRWYSTRGLPWLLNDKRLCEQMGSLMERFRTVYNAADVEAYPITQALELRCIWNLLCMCRVAVAAHKSAASGNNNNNNSEYDQKDAQASGLNEATRRLAIFEDLVSGAVVDTNLADLARIGSVQHDHVKLRELEFWRLIGKFLTLRDDEASAAKEIDDALAGCRTLLDSRENRDVIYSIAIARHIGQRVAEFPASVPDSISADEEDAKTKLGVAKQFIESEAHGRGTTLVIQRLCAMATRAWQAASSAAPIKEEATATGKSEPESNHTSAEVVTDPALK